MLPRNCLRISRQFSSKNHKQAIFKFHLAYAGVVCAVLGGFKVYLSRSTDPKVKAARSLKVKEFALHDMNFQGVMRPLEAQSVIKASEQHSIIIFAPKCSGKTYFMKYLSTLYKPAVLLEIQPDIVDTLNYFKFEQPLHEGNFNDFLASIENAIRSTPDSLLLIDSFERLSDMYKRRFLEIIKIWVNEGATRLIISTNERETVSFCNAFADTHEYLLEALTHDEFLLVCKSTEGFVKAEIEYLWQSCGSDLDYAFEMMRNKETATELLNRKKEEITAWAAGITNDKAYTDKIIGILGTVTESAPLGDTFGANKIAKEMVNQKLMYYYPNTSAKFRNSFVISVLKEIFYKN